MHSWKPVTATVVQVGVEMVELLPLLLLLKLLLLLLLLPRLLPLLVGVERSLTRKRVS